VLPVECTDPAGWTRGGLAVFEPAGDGWQGISVLTPPDGYQRVDLVQTSESDLVVDWQRVTPEGGESGPRITDRHHPGAAISTAGRSTAGLTAPDHRRSAPALLLRLAGSQYPELVAVRPGELIVSEGRTQHASIRT
jgi:hypothetical protein